MNNKKHRIPKRLTERKIEHSQNFIYQPELVEKLVQLAQINTRDLVVEIGAGKGIITKELIKIAGRVIAIEKDPRFKKDLGQFNAKNNLEVVECDFLKFPLPREKFKVFSNIPFNATTDIIHNLTAPASKATDIYLIMQEDAAFRFAGMPYQKNSQNSILLAVDFKIEILKKISRNYFKPVPKVNIVFTHFSRFAEPLISQNERQNFRDFVVYGYNQWAPNVLEAFKKIFSNKQLSIINRLYGLEKLKPSQLSLETWLILFDTYSQHASEKKRHLVQGSEKRLGKEQKKLKKWNRSRLG